jgi:hypothetical protein
MIIFVFKKHENFMENLQMLLFFSKIYGENGRGWSWAKISLQAGVGAS